MKLLSRFKVKRSNIAPAQLDPDQRIYVIGDIHGRLDLLRILFDKIRAELPADSQKKIQLVVLGDFIDRGPATAALFAFLHRISTKSRTVTVLKGNHEAILLSVLDGDFAMLDLWLEFGGLESLESWGIAPSLINTDNMRGLISALKAAIPTEQLAWLRQLPVSHRIGPYFFAHAGVRPGVPLDEQETDDLLWIREPFLESVEDHGAIIVHGHSASEDGPHFLPNRIGIDTAAYRSGRLIALGIEAERQWVVSAQEPKPPLDLEGYKFF